KLRPAARALGISPMKVRETFRRMLETAIAEAGGDQAAAARALRMPAAVLARKIDDLRMDGAGEEADAP
ncbi:MAG: hypothetical protein JXP34_04935, partial [Planctomycetes bacterium]|nr:hypothetical protein [Planctomycetota bacterium]